MSKKIQKFRNPKKRKEKGRWTKVSQGLENLGIQPGTWNGTMRKTVMLFDQDRNSPLVSHGRDIHIRHKGVWKTYAGRSHAVVRDNNRNGV